MDGALVEYPDMAVIFTVGDPACIGALAAIKNAGATTKMIGFDANPEAHEAILDEVNGKIWIADVAQDPYQIGYQISQQMMKYLTTGAVDNATILISPLSGGRFQRQEALSTERTLIRGGAAPQGASPPRALHRHRRRGMP